MSYGSLRSLLLLLLHKQNCHSKSVWVSLSLTWSGEASYEAVR